MEDEHIWVLATGWGVTSSESLTTKREMFGSSGWKWFSVLHSHLHRIRIRSNTLLALWQFIPITNISHHCYIMSLSGLAGLVKCNCFQNKKLYQNDILAQEQNGW